MPIENFSVDPGDVLGVRAVSGLAGDFTLQNIGREYELLLFDVANPVIGVTPYQVLPPGGLTVLPVGDEDIPGTILAPNALDSLSLWWSASDWAAESTFNDSNPVTLTPIPDPEYQRN